ncbi:alpha/beta-hydrolase [Epithele typhae]|uniref:alpha/beta-hydrolase n=1 Tax=Epithele typhae TaxID=378194 RepID=UPI0020083D73|nr:alpha/beta-hydrolase [Epithele typhae]KAH9922866.1 alpha/beta-hydrolase [Epithele typhae]
MTMVYKVVDNLAIDIDIYLPTPPHARDSRPKCPAVVYFHGGSLVVGNRKSWFPTWLHQRVVSSGMAFISADYRLIPPSTGHDILSDVKDLFKFLQDGVNPRIRELTLDQPSFEIASDAIAVAGSSAGGLCAYLAAIHASPQPKAVLSLYGMGGNLLTGQYLDKKLKPFFRGRELLDIADFAEFVHPASAHLPPLADSPLAYHPPTYHIPGYPANPRMLAGRLYLQTGTFLDYYTGQHEPSLSVALVSTRQDVDPPKEEVIPVQHRILFPQFCVSADLPPMFIIHGSTDTAVFLDESQRLHGLLENAGVRSTLRVVKDKEHSFDYDPTAEDEFGGPGGLFDEAVNFLKSSLF